MATLINDLDPSTTTTFTASVGDIIKLCRPAGYPPWAPGGSADLDEVNTDYELNGFKLLEPRFGRLIRQNEIQSNSICVFYKHEKSGKQIISYFAGGALVPITFYAVIQGILVHDHASIYTGGPAFATYFAETPEEE